MTDRIPLDQLTSDALDALYERLDAAEDSESQRQLATAREALASATTRAARSEAAIARVRALAERWRYTGDRKGTALPELLTALDSPPPPATAATQATEPREHCGDLKPQFSESTDRTECVLRPGHNGSHADHNNTRWWWTDQQHEQPLAVPHDMATTLHRTLGQLLGDEDAQTITRVRALHQQDYNTCGWCSTNDRFVAWPCPTIQALDGEEPADA